MLTATLLTLAVLVTGAGFGLLWRKLEELRAEIRDLRALLEERDAAARQQPSASAQPSNITALSRPVVVRATPAPARNPEPEEEPSLFPPAAKPPSDDPFNDSWVIRQAPPTRAPATRPAPPPAERRAIDPALPPPPRRPSLPPQRGERFTSTQRLLIAGSVMLAPAIALLFNAPPAAVAIAALVLLAAVLAASLRPGWSVLAWTAAIGGGAWALWAVSNEAIGAHPIAAASSLAFAAVLGLAHARVSALAGPGGLLALGMSAAALLLSDHALAGLGAFGAIAALAALIGASRASLELIHVGAWISACLWLFLLGARPDAAIWYAPAAAWTGGLFLAIAAVRAPALAERGTVIAATGALAPIVAVLMLHASARTGAAPWTFDQAWQCALALCVIALALAGILALCANRARSLSALGWAAFPLGFGAPAAAALAAIVALAPPFAATALAAIAAILALLNTRYGHPMWRFGGALAGFASVIAALAAIGDFALSPRDLTATLTIVLGAGLPAALALLAARAFGSSAPISAMGFETGALLLGVAALSGLIRLAYAETPSAPLDFAEAGLHATLWLTLALLIWLRARRGAWLVREWGAAVLGGAALCILLGGPLTALNPLWGAIRDPATGAPFANLLALGFAAPALAAWGHYIAWRGRGRGVVAAAAGVVLTTCWALLEVRRAFHGADLAGPLSLAEFGAMLGALAACAALAAAARAALVRQTISSRSTSEGRPARQAPIFGPAARK